MSCPPFAPNTLSKLKINSSFTATRRPDLKRLAAGVSTTRRVGALIALFAIITTIFYNGSSASAASTPAGETSAPASLRFVAPRTTTASVAPLFSPAMFQLFPTETLTTYEADCLTEKSDFNLGDTVCVRATYPAIFFFRRITWIDPDNHILDAPLVSSSGGTHTFTLPGSATSNIGGNTVDNRGTWRIDLRTADGSRSATASFVVHEPANPRADLQISVSGGDRVIDSGTSVTVKVAVYNAGPDAATNLEVSALSVSGLSLSSFSAAVGGDCGTGGVCSVGSLPSGDHALFLATYDATAAAGSKIQATASVASDTEDPRSLNNSDSSLFTISQNVANPQTCALTAPQPITVNGSELPDPNDPNETLYGAVVTYAVSAEGDGCDPVQCDTPSGSAFPAGTTLVTCTAASGDSVAFPVTVVDTRSFGITLNGANPLVVECNSTPPFADPGAITNRPGITPTATSNVDPLVPGTYTITYTATDGTSTATATRTVNVVDDAPPLITLNGDDPLTPDEIETQEITIECHAAFTDPGATASDACSGATPLTISSNVDPNTVGTYTITYSATDQQGTPGNPADDLTSTLTRTVHVVDTTAPVITLTGGDTLTVECHGVFTDPGAVATDACAGDLNSAVQVSGTVDPNTVGTYTLNYTVSDAHGNQSTATRTVNVVDTTAPVININDANPAVVECHTSYTDAGATANDACDGAVPVTTSGSVDVDTPGTYTITYTATDGTNVGTATRTVKVVDTIAPVISCPANIVVELPANTSDVSVPVSFNPTATDSCGTATVSTSHASGAHFPVGTTTVTATATDPSLNSSSCTFTVTVLYRFAGFFSPISNLPTINTVKAGSAIPIKFSLSGNKGLNIFAADSPASGVIACNSTDPAVDLTQIDTTGASTLTYDAGSDRYHYNWKTQKAWEGTCRQLVVTLKDGTEHRANFKFK
ncbi:MAG TPA: immunoglobulin-like domain-containing protein [Pyrinomonadaceae bacterium]|nr:immunoglobulin-like domain-containing protein [Pyrinomonadaceae bacterium]